MIRLLAPIATLGTLVVASPAAADEAARCLNRQEQKAAIASGQAVPLATAIRAARGSVSGHGGREVVKARLCRDAKALVYVLTVLARDGKVTRATVDAGSGKLVDAR